MVYDREGDEGWSEIAFVTGQTIYGSYRGRPRLDARGHPVGTLRKDLGDFHIPTRFDLAPAGP